MQAAVCLASAADDARSRKGVVFVRWKGSNQTVASYCCPQVTSTNETVGTFAIAYAAHKALSPVRFPPTVALTPVVARWLGKEPAAAADGSSNGAAAEPGSDKRK